MISIITITYNAETTIKRTLESVAQQTNHNIEHIFIDGASKDNTVAILTDYRNANIGNFNIEIISEPDKGLYDAMNKGLRIAKGQWVCFLNSGDKLHDVNTLKTISSFNSENAGVIYGNTDIVDSDGKFLYKRRLTPPEHLSWKSFKNGMLVCHQSFYARKEICPEYDLQYRFSADVDWCIKVMKEAKKRNLSLINSHSILTDYLEEGMTTKNHKASLMERFRVMRKHYGLVTTVTMHLWFVVRNFLHSPS